VHLVKNDLVAYWPWQPALASHWLDGLANSTPAHTHYLTAVGQSYAASDLVTQFFKSAKFFNSKIRLAYEEKVRAVSRN
jgi:hypothetical protein